MADYFEQIADQWRQRSGELAVWTMSRLVNRTDVWGRYLPMKQRERGQGGRNQAITAPFRDQRGKVFLDHESLEKHFRTRAPGGVLGVHSSSADLTSRWLAVDIDLHDPDDLSVSPQANFVAAQGWWQQLRERGFDPLLLDSNGQGGFHLLLIFAEPRATADVHAFVTQMVSDYAMRGLDDRPEVFPGSPRWNHYGDWLRLPGRHHSRMHYTRVWSGEPWQDPPWLEGHDAIDRLLSTVPASNELAEQLGIGALRRTVCLDFDGVIHSYRSGWCGADIIPDAPIHGAREAIARLRKTFRIVVHSTRCQSPEGCEAIRVWLHKHDIVVDEISACKPPAMVYLDDRAVRFQGDWDDAIAAIHDFRR